MPAKRTELNDRDNKCIDAYFSNGFNKTDAMLQAGFSKSYAKVQQRQFFGNPVVKAEIRKRMRKTHADYEIIEGRILERLEVLSEINAGEIYERLLENEMDISCLTTDEKYALAEIQVDEQSNEVEGADGKVKKTTTRKIKLKCRDVKTALDTLARHRGLIRGVAADLGTDAGGLADRVQENRDRMAKRKAELAKK